MDSGLYSIAPEAVMKWILIGFAVAFFLKDFQKKFPTPRMTLQVAAAVAITLSIILLFLLVAGFDNTVIALLGVGAGIVLHLFIAAAYRYIPVLWAKRKQAPKQLPANSNIAKSSISAPNQLSSH